jgi:hypothetical protein
MIKSRARSPGGGGLKICARPIGDRLANAAKS